MSFRWAQRLGAGVVDCLFPPRCGACDAVGWAPLCRLCAEATLAPGSLSLPGFDQVRVAYDYGGPVALAVRALKFDQRPELGRALGRALERLPRNHVQGEFAVPIPQTHARQRERGYNPARELARALSMPVRTRVLRRRGAPRPQVGLSHEARRRNQRDAFVADPRRLRGRHVWVVDDVLTTGATVGAAREALVSAGAVSVSLLVLCVAETLEPETRL